MNFDEKRDKRLDDRSFTIGGVDFLARPGVRPEEMAAHYDRESAPTKEDGTPDEEASMAYLDDLILLLIEPEDREKWTELRKREEHPVTLGDVSDVQTWLLERVTGRPTTAPSPGSAGRLTTIPPSAGASSSPEATPTT